MPSLPLLFPFRSRRHGMPAGLLACGMVFGCLLHGVEVSAQDWSGAFKIVTADEPVAALQVTGAAPRAGDGVSIGEPSSAAKQSWTIVPKGNGLYTIKPSANSSLALSVADGGSTDGTPIVLAQSADQASQEWSIHRNPNGTLSLLPKNASGSGLDDFGGNKAADAKIDLWTFSSDDPHLQWRLEPMAGATAPPAPTPGPSVAADAVPEGTLKEFVFKTSTIFPGTVRHCAVFIPAQYDGSKPACVYVKQDGYDPKNRKELAALIAAKEMPVTVGVFVQSGEMPSPAKGAAPRRNRSFEYDSVNDNYARFLIEELLPYVAKTYDLKLSDKASDRCVAGASSGGISAFNVAWARPDAFSRVYACSGSFVAFRGGNEFPALVRQTEAKPIRAYLTTGTGDMVNCAGDWFLLDQEVDKALKFSGYDIIFHAVNGGHCAGWNENFADAMRFLWKDWPQPVPTPASAPRVRDIVTPGDQWEVAAQGRHELRSPACNSKGEVFFVDSVENKVYRLGLDNRTEVFLADAAQADGLCVGPHDELYTVSSRTGNVLCYDAAGRGRVYASGLRAEHVLAMPTKGLYVTSVEERPGEGGKVWYVEDGNKTVVDSGLKEAAGLTLRPDQWLLQVADERSRWVFSYEVDAANNRLINKERFFWLHVADWDDDAGAESVCYSREGHLLVGTRMGIQACSDDGNTQVILPVPDHRRVTGVCLGGPGLNTLFAFCGDKVWKRVVKVHADGAFTPWTHTGGSPL